MTKKVKIKSLNLDVIINEMVFEKIMHWCKKNPDKEVSGLGNVIYDSEVKALRVTEAWLLKQENTGTTTDIEENSIGELEFKHHKMVKAGEIEGELKFWWHSHADMGVFWSGTDMDTIEQLGSGGWFLSTVFNIKEEMRSAVYQTDPMEFFADELTTLVTTSVAKDDLIEALEVNGIKAKFPEKILELVSPVIKHKQIKEWDKEYDDNVTIKTPTYAGYGKYGHWRGKGASGTNRNTHAVGSKNWYDEWYEDYYGDETPSTKGTVAGEDAAKDTKSSTSTFSAEFDDDDIPNPVKKSVDLVGKIYDPKSIIEDAMWVLVIYPNATDGEIVDDLGYSYPGVDLMSFIKMNRKNIEEALLSA